MAPKQKYCGQCGSQNVLENKYCNFCGSRFPELASLPPAAEETVESRKVPVSEPDLAASTFASDTEITEAVANEIVEDVPYEQDSLPTGEEESDSPKMTPQTPNFSTSDGVLEQKIARLLEYSGQMTIQGEEGLMFVVCEAEQDVLHLIMSGSLTYSSSQQHIFEALGFTEVDYNLQRTINFENKQEALNECVYVTKVVFEEAYGETPANLRFIEDFGHRRLLNEQSMRLARRKWLYIILAVFIILIFGALIAKIG